VPHSLQDISQELEKMKSQKAVKATRKKKVGREVPSRLMETTAAHRAKSTNQVSYTILYLLYYILYYIYYTILYYTMLYAYTVLYLYNLSSNIFLIS